MRKFVLALVIAIIALVAAGCAGAPTTSPTVAPAASKSEPTKAPAAAAPTQAVAQPTAAPATKKLDYPQAGKAITFIIPWAAGGPTDVGGRLLASALEKELKVPVQVVNKDGAGSQVGITELAQSKPDGYTVGMTNLPSSMTPYLDPSRKAAYNRSSLIPVANQVWDPETLGVTADSPYKTLDDLVKAAKANPGTIKAAITGIQSDNHLALMLLQKVAGIKFQVVTMNGSAQANPALLGGHVDVLFQSAGGFGPMVKSNQVRLLGMMDKQENRLFPGVKTLQSQGHDVVYSTSRGISVPAGTPQEIVDVLADATKKAVESAELRQKMDESFINQLYMGPKEYAAFWEQFETQTKELVALTNQQ